MIDYMSALFDAVHFASDGIFSDYYNRNVHDDTKYQM